MSFVVIHYPLLCIHKRAFLCDHVGKVHHWPSSQRGSSGLRDSYNCSSTGRSIHQWPLACWAHAEMVAVHLDRRSRNKNGRCHFSDISSEEIALAKVHLILMDFASRASTRHP